MWVAGILIVDILFSKDAAAYLRCVLLAAPCEVLEDKLLTLPAVTRSLTRTTLNLQHLGHTPC